ncbi:hypothetical protein GLOIN_2v1765743 [Rhizophagus irregularis DAOM 181602=DAOM 197198]|nr:hypothetical protein GLOIN_2v1765743 [Rhizophagus irregularis DAOM 181602=DAOM 197198]
MGHNINGIGPDDFKLNILMDYCANKRADIVGIVETNKDRKYGKFWNKQNPEYIPFWTNKDNKIKGSGVCIVINKKWEKHLGKINRIGDLNTYIDKSLDYSGPSKLGKKPSNIITWLDNTFFVDTFRKLNPKQRSFMWSNKITSTRIDYIWTDPKLEARIMKSHIYQSANITDSDHNITFAKISFADIIVTNNKGGRRAEKKTKRIVYDYENTTNEQWNENYKEIENSSKERKDLLYIRSIMRKLYKNELKGAELLKASKEIKTFNKHYRTNISKLTEDTDWHTWKCETRNWLKIVRRVIKMKDKECKEATIKRRIEERNNMIITDQRKMINNILDKTYSKINLDRICIVTDTQEEILLNTKEEVQAEAINAFSSLFCARNHKFENLPEQWKTIYEP